MSDDISVIEDFSDHRYFTMIPNIVIESELSHTALRLYIWYKKICGESDTGRCYQSLKTVGEGCHLSSPTIIKARDELVENGLIVVNRVTKSDGHQQVTTTINDIWDVNNEWYRPESTVDPNSSAYKESLPPYKKGLIGLLKKLNRPIKNLKPNKNPVKKRKKRKGGSNKVARTSTGFLISSFDRKAAGHLREVLVIHDADLVSAPRRVRIDTLAKSIFRLRTERKVSEDEIRTMIKWLKKEYSDVHTPDIHKADDLFTKWGKFRGARNRWLSDNGEVEVSKVEKDSESVANRVRNWLEANNSDIDFLDGGFAEQSEVDEALKALGMEAGSVNAEDL